jgi:hypothetical protein
MLVVLKDEQIQREPWRLVGMSNGARKRVARIWTDAEDERRFREGLRPAVGGGLECTDRSTWPGIYAEARERYRVGERLSWDPPNGGVVRK